MELDTFSFIPVLLIEFQCHSDIELEDESENHIILRSSYCSRVQSFVRVYIYGHSVVTRR